MKLDVNALSNSAICLSTDFFESDTLSKDSFDCSSIFPVLFEYSPLILSWLCDLFNDIGGKAIKTSFLLGDYGTLFAELELSFSSICLMLSFIALSFSSIGLVCSSIYCDTILSVLFKKAASLWDSMDLIWLTRPVQFSPWLCDFIRVTMIPEFIFFWSIAV